jgi:hypothetical protein
MKIEFHRFDRFRFQSGHIRTDERRDRPELPAQAAQRFTIGLALRDGMQAIDEAHQNSSAGKHVANYREQVLPPAPLGKLDQELAKAGDEIDLCA